MEKFKLNFELVFGAGKSLLFLMENKKKIPHIVNIKNIPNLVIPDACRFFDYFKKPLLTPLEAPENSILTMDEFNNHRVVPAKEVKINIVSDGKAITTIDLYAGFFSDFVFTGMRF